MVSELQGGCVYIETLAEARLSAFLRGRDRHLVVHLDRLPPTMVLIELVPSNPDDRTPDGFHYRENRENGRNLKESKLS